MKRSKSIWSNKYKFLLGILFALFMICFILSPLAYMLKNNLNSGSHVPATENKRTAYSYIKFPAIVTNFPEKENNTELGSARVFFRDYQRVYNGGVPVQMLPDIFIGLAIIIFLLTYRKAQKDKSEIAYFIGGHAPPIIYRTF